jgi:hypothetical protein
LSVLAAVVLVQFAVAQSPPPVPTPVVNADEGLTQEQVAANIAANRANFEEDYRRWLEDVIQSGRDPRTLPRSPAAAFYLPPSNQSLDESVRSASAAVVGRVVNVEFGPFTGALVTMLVESSLKGPARAGTSVQILMGGGPFPDPQFKDGVLLFFENAPLLLRGDRALVLLEEPSAEGVHTAQGFTGLYNLQGGVARGVEGNPFLAQVDGLPEAALFSRVAAAVP